MPNKPRYFGVRYEYSKKMKCSVSDCENRVIAKGLCNKHYQRMTVHGDVNKVIVRIRPQCSIEGCNNKSHAHTLCPMHHRRLERHGDPLFINPKCNRDGKYRERHKGYQKLWRKRNHKSYNAYLTSRKKRIKKATPKWSETILIKKFYMNCPLGHHVDHIIPLNGRLVSGLHVLNNLQYLSAVDNMKKGNKFKS